jgi:hypothetical protein
MFVHFVVSMLVHFLINLVIFVVWQKHKKSILQPVLAPSH